MANKSKRDAQRLKAAIRQRKMVDLRVAGLGWQEISDKLGYGGHANAMKDWKRVMASVQSTEEERKEARRVAIVRMERLFAAVWKQAQAGSLPHWDRAQRSVERFAAFFGLDAPKQQHNTDVHFDVDPMTLTDDEIAQIGRGVIPASFAGRRRDGEAPSPEGQEPNPGGEEPPGDMGG